MKYIVSWTFPTAFVRESTERFLKTGGAPPAGVKVIGRWHGMNGTGFAIAETTDAKALYHWYSEWSDVLAIQVTPCLEDADAGAVLAALKG